MNIIVKLTKLISLTAIILLLCLTNIIAQVKPRQTYAHNKKKPASTKPAPAITKSKSAPSVSKQFKDFTQLAAEANATFTLPAGFKEIPATNDEDFSFDYAMELPGKDFEVWFQIKSQKENWVSYEKAKNDNTRQTENPDSLYLNMGKAQATAFTGDTNYFTRSIPQGILTRYNADAGKSYLLNLLDLPATKHYKYALLITLQRNHTGTILAVCFTNEKGPEFFKNVNKAGSSLRFKS